MRSLSLHHLIRGLILIGFAMYIVYLSRTGNMTYYIAPRMEPYVKLSALLFYALAVQQLYFAIMGWWRKRSMADCDCGHIPSGFPLKSWVMYLLFIFPLLLGSFLPDAMLGSAMADQKGMRLSAISSNPSVEKSRSQTDDAAESSDTSVEQPTTPADEPPVPAETEAEEEQAADIQTDAAELEALFPSDAFTEIYALYARSIYDEDTVVVDEKSYTEILTTLDLYLDAFQGKTIEITGFVYRTEAMLEQQFAVGRFAMTCCSADASPYGVFSEFADAKSLKDDEWVTITGKIGKTQFNEMDIMKIDVVSVKKTEQPEEPYVYPNYDFGSDLQ